VRTEVAEAENLEERAENLEKARQAFSFGGKRGNRRGPRRLFAPTRSALSPAYQIRQERPHAILRMLSE